MFEILMHIFPIYRFYRNCNEKIHIYVCGNTFCMDNTAIFLTVNYKFLLHDKNEQCNNLVTL